jgi:hypothetical protein
MADPLASGSIIKAVELEQGTSDLAEAGSFAGDLGGDESWQHYRTHIAGTLRADDSAHERFRAALRAAVHADDS